MSVIRWEDPPVPTWNGRPAASRTASRSVPATGIVADLLASPGRWALIAEVPASTSGPLVTRIRRGSGPFAPAGAFEATSRQGHDGQRLVYARYVGGAP